MKMMSDMEIREAITSEFSIPEAAGLSEITEPVVLDEYEERLAYGLSDALV